MADIILKVDHLKKYFKTPRGMLHAVDDVSFAVERGKTLGVVGESGCGKSTMGRCLNRLIEPTDGEICFDGVDVRALSGRRMRQMRSRMQFIFQDPYSSLDPRQTVYEAIAEAVRAKKNRKGEQIAQRTYELMDTVGLARRLASSYPHELDGGRRQRIGIARALAMDPEFIVCDEPVSALDVSIQAQILNLLNDLQRQYDLTYIFITHDLAVVNHISDEIAVMYLGKLVEKAPVDMLFDDPRHPYTKALLSAIPIPETNAVRERITIKGEVTSPIEPAEACRFSVRCPYATDRCHSCEPQLREVSEGHYVSCFLCEDQ